jgi:hypothetical protein
VLVAPEFPPSNTAGAHRPRLFAKHLAAFGWTPTVLTIRRDQIEGPIDERLDALVPHELDVIRTGALPIRPVRLVGDLGIRTLWPHARAIRALARDGGVDAAVLFGPPWFSFALGPTVCRRLGIPYVIDYIDPWTSVFTAAHRFPSRGWFFHRGARAIEPRSVRAAAHVTAVSEGILDELRVAYPWLRRESTTAMGYGAEADDFADAARLGVAPPDFAPGSGEVTIAFTGALQPTGGPLLRSVFQAIAGLQQSGSDLGRRLRLRCYGTSNLTWGHGRYAVLPIARELGVGAAVSELPERIPYLEALAVQRASDIVLVMGSRDRYYHASKLYPAILSGRPVLALCHEASSIRSVMSATGAGACVTFGDAGDPDVAELRRAIERLAERGPREPAWREVERFTARASTAALARVLDGIAGRALRQEAV